MFITASYLRYGRPIELNCMDQIRSCIEGSKGIIDPPMLKYNNQNHLFSRTLKVLKRAMTVWWSLFFYFLIRYGISFYKIECDLGHLFLAVACTSKIHRSFGPLFTRQVIRTFSKFSNTTTSRLKDTLKVPLRICYNIMGIIILVNILNKMMALMASKHNTIFIS